MSEDADAVGSGVGREEPEETTGSGAPARKQARRYSKNSRPGVSWFGVGSGHAPVLGTVREEGPEPEPREEGTELTLEPSSIGVAWWSDMVRGGGGGEAGRGGGGIVRVCGGGGDGVDGEEGGFVCRSRSERPP